MTFEKMLKKLLTFVGVLAFWLMVWVLVSYSVGSELLFPSPISVLKALCHLAATKDFWLSTLFSLLRVLLGIFLSFALGTLLAILTEYSSVLRALFSPLLGIIKATPVASFIILALLWISRNTLPMYITALIVVPIVWSNISEGIRSVDKTLIEVTQVYKFSKKDKLFKLYVPSVAPFFMASCKSALGMAWKAGISAEVLSTPQRAIGTELYFSKTYLETPSLFAWTAVIILLSVIIEKLLVGGLNILASHLKALPKGEKNDSF